MSDPKLTADNVRDAVSRCLYTDEELPADGSVPDGAIMTKAVMSAFGFHPERLERERENVAAMLRELPPQFMKDSGGGWSFLNACVDRNGRQWAEHPTIDALLAIGVGLGMVEFCLPREVWGALPGGMPYFVVDLDGRRSGGAELNADYVATLIAKLIAQATALGPQPTAPIIITESIEVEEIDAEPGDPSDLM